MQLHNNHVEPWNKGNLITNGIKLKDIPGVYGYENYQAESAVAKAGLQHLDKETYSHEDIFGNYCHLAEYINCPVEMAFEYSKNVYSLEEWTFSVRDLEHVKDGLYKGKDNLAKDTYIYVRIEAYPESKAVDYLCAWDRGEELWMRYYIRFVDAMPTIRKPGTVMLWTNCKHPYYDRNCTDVPDSIIAARNRTDRVWVGDLWSKFYVGHMLEAKNKKAILEYCFANAQLK